MFTLTFMDSEGALPLFNLAVFDDMFIALRWVRDNIPGSYAWDWGFDGDCLFTGHDKTYTDRAGNLYTGGYGIMLN